MMDGWREGGEYHCPFHTARAKHQRLHTPTLALPTPQPRTTNHKPQPRTSGATLAHGGNDDNGNADDEKQHADGQTGN